MPGVDDVDLRSGRRADDEKSLDPAAAEPGDERASEPSEEPSYESYEPPYKRPWEDEEAAARSGRGKRAAIVIAVIAALLVGTFWVLSRRVEPPEPGSLVEAGGESDQAEPTTSEPAREAASEAALPPLGESDSLVRRLVSELSRHPALASWLASSDLVRTFAASVENLSLGDTPSPNLKFMAPREPYTVVERRAVSGGSGTETVPDPASYHRYDVIAEVFTSIDPERAAGVYRRLRPLVQEAFAELGYPDQSFDSALADAIRMLLDAPVPDSPPLLERHIGSYRYADPRLEELAPAQKQLLRMGPDNARRIRAQLRQLAGELDLEID